MFFTGHDRGLKSFISLKYLYYVDHAICVVALSTLLQMQLNEPTQIFTVRALCKYEATNPGDYQK